MRGVWIWTNICSTNTIIRLIGMSNCNSLPFWSENELLSPRITCSTNSLASEIYFLSYISSVWWFYKNAICNNNAVLATNTSSISIDLLSDCCNNPDKMIGMHFMNPVPIMKLVEVMIGKYTSDETQKIVIEVAKKMNKIPVICNDSPGFVANRILIPMINERRLFIWF